MRKQELETKGIIFDIQRFSVHDGPGIRTLVFLKGCPLSCRWCSNPESQEQEPQIMFVERNCLRCKRCAEVCPLGAIEFTPIFKRNSEKCVQCESCIDVCCSNALIMSGRLQSVDQVINELAKDNIHYRRSGGGITLSGGEPLFQAEFSHQILKACKAKGWHTAMETTGFANERALELVLPWLDLVLLDIKHLDDQKHQSYVGQSNQLILKNAETIGNYRVPIVVRVPVIPGFNDNRKAIQEIAEFARSIKQVTELHLLPYHRLGEQKYQYLERKYEMEMVKPLTKDQLSELRDVAVAAGLPCKIGG
ncbi:glycyl-radical enzyme activating protein [Pelosinus sp. sgz500959]|uniref:glycyl-radical enzyme activating protein n=1 Tax=Pelosinus sp. sgz500959 TaxID=3242472 RepID=UPI00366C32FA